ncbi:GNAT family N-acetyltransferase [Mitsuaria sp. GD03876]|uniref:GNAT family N-acetyltransferase n=1 Tax=Mitsuaria sp. GD03876 TaxID=2975399 RepID=UPI0024471B60|nr:GNAT family N-acetyltransferase [Mitsuaria sp. GD03876]MDH0863067.1 GNAT family N-acetyltransferase [Mitsuaria sp. GD03876]
MVPPELDALARRAELAGLNAASAPREAHVDGWLLRLSPGHARRSRCVNAVAAGSLPLNEVLRRCRAAFDQAGLPLILRLTPFSQPADLAEQLGALGWRAFGPSEVMVLPSLDAFEDDHGLVALTSADYAALIGRLRGSSDAEIDGHARRLEQASVRHQAFQLVRDGELLACGQVAIDPGPDGSSRDGMAGLFDIFTPPSQRGQGHGRRLCAALLAIARRQGASSGYLQVAAENEAAKRLYASLGFLRAYDYHYRSDDPRTWD